MQGRRLLGIKRNEVIPASEILVGKYAKKQRGRENAYNVADKKKNKKEMSWPCLREYSAGFSAYYVMVLFPVS